MSAATLLAVCSAALGVDNVSQLPAAADELMRMYPGVQVRKEQDRVRILYGMPMTPGLTARAAAELFLQTHGEAFGCGPLEVSEVWSTDISRGGKTVFAYQQYLAGIPVELGTLRVLVLNGPVPRVVYASGNLAPQLAEANLAEPTKTAEEALKTVRDMKRWQSVPRWSTPELVVFQGDGDWITPVVCWKFVGDSANPADALCKTFFVNAATGALVYTREEIQHTDVVGSIQGIGSPGTLPDVSYNLPVPLPVPGMRAQVSGGSSAYTNGAGQFTIPNPGTSPVNVTCGVNGVGAAQWLNLVAVTGGPNLTGAVNGVTPPGPVNLVLNEPPLVGQTAQVNAFIGTILTHNYIKDRAPGFTGLDMQLMCNTGVAGTCNAFFQPGASPPTSSSINFFNTGGGCVNSAYSTVVSHEYGHFIVNRLNLAQNAFGEGYGDLSAEMIWDDFIVAKDFYGPGVHIRNILTANQQYPCNGEIHTCGQLLAGVWWRVRDNMVAFYGTQNGLADTRQLEVDWSMITLGGPTSTNSAGPSTAIEALTADDDNGNISDGTPNYSRICAGFALHNIQCPVLTFLTFQYPSGRPTQVTPGQQFSFPLNIVGVTGTPQPGSGNLSYRVGSSGAFTTTPLVQGSPNEYTVSLPALSCGQEIQYYLSGRTTANLLVTDPGNAPVTYFSASALVGTSSEQAVGLNFNADPGWTVINDASLTSGFWERVTPVVSGGTGTPTTAFGGSGLCWVTDNRPSFDVDGGPTVLLSTVYNLAQFPRITVSYRRWLYSSAGDPMTFEYSTNGGSSWTILETTPGTASAAWSLRSFDIVAPTATTRFRWTISDNPNNSQAEAAVDEFEVLGLICPTAVCYANCDGSTTAPILNVADFSCFLNRFAAGESYANCDNSTTPPVLNVADFSCFLNAFASGCT